MKTTFKPHLLSKQHLILMPSSLISIVMIGVLLISTLAISSLIFMPKTTYATILTSTQSKLNTCRVVKIPQDKNIKTLHNYTQKRKNITCAKFSKNMGEKFIEPSVKVTRGNNKLVDSTNHKYVGLYGMKKVKAKQTLKASIRNLLHVTPVISKSKKTLTLKYKILSPDEKAKIKISYYWKICDYGLFNHSYYMANCKTVSKSKSYKPSTKQIGKLLIFQMHAKLAGFSTKYSYSSALFFAIK